MDCWYKSKNEACSNNVEAYKSELSHGVNLYILSLFVFDAVLMNFNSTVFLNLKITLSITDIPSSKIPHYQVYVPVVCFNPIIYTFFFDFISSNVP